MQLTTLLLLPLLSLLTLTLASKPCKTGLNEKGPCTCSCPYPFTLLYNGHDATNDMPFWCRGTEIGTEELNQMYGPVGTHMDYPTALRRSMAPREFHILAPKFIKGVRFANNTLYISLHPCKASKPMCLRSTQAGIQPP
ncbi:MAG: hypothetical protein LQ339_003176 [Xanthoria mediterranea]|nr:MAG: hypothetical protein LQ339_003176 [Xanthoria mediterranea]